MSRRSDAIREDAIRCCDILADMQDPACEIDDLTDTGEAATLCDAAFSAVCDAEPSFSGWCDECDLMREWAEAASLLRDGWKFGDGAELLRGRPMTPPTDRCSPEMARLVDNCAAGYSKYRPALLAAIAKLEAAQAEADRKLAALVGAVESALSKADQLVTCLRDTTDIDNMGRAGDICRTLRAALPKEKP